jgi:hypothetical protein
MLEKFTGQGGSLQVKVEPGLYVNGTSMQIRV